MTSCRVGKAREGGTAAAAVGGRPPVGEGWCRFPAYYTLALLPNSPNLLFTPAMLLRQVSVWTSVSMGGERAVRQVEEWSGWGALFIPNSDTRRQASTGEGAGKGKSAVTGFLGF